MKLLKTFLTIMQVVFLLGMFTAIAVFTGEEPAVKNILAFWYITVMGVLTIVFLQKAKKQ